MDDEFDSELVCSELSDAQAISVGVGVGKEFLRDVVDAADIVLEFMPNSVRLDGSAGIPTAIDGWTNLHLQNMVIRDSPSPRIYTA